MKDLGKLAAVATIIATLIAIVQFVGNDEPQGPGQSKPQIHAFRVSPDNVTSGETATLAWEVSGATRVTISPEIGNVSLTGNRSVSPAGTTVYTLKAENSAGEVTASARIAVAVAPSLPDLVITDIILKDKRPQDSIIVNTAVKNNGKGFRNAFIVSCSYLCSGNFTFFSGMRVDNGLDQNEEVVLGDNAELYLGDCSFQASREFTCTVDIEDTVDESDESNNERTETLLTSR